MRKFWVGSNRARGLRAALALLLLVGIVGQSQAQWRGGRGGRRGGGDGVIYYTEGDIPVDTRVVKTAREVASHSTDVPVWTNPPEFQRDVFTFVRIIRDRSDSYNSAGDWITDFPDSDLNISFRLQQVTSIRTDPNCRIMRLTDKDLFRFPFIYMVEPGALLLREEEVPILRNYLLNGGFLMADDFWGEWQWECFAAEIKRVFPDREFEELPMDHPIFHCVFDLKGPKNSLQTPSIRIGVNSQRTGVTWETHRQQDGSMEACSEMHVRALKDDKGRIMILATHNCDNGDGWEREGENDWFFHEFSEKRAFPLGINIIFYAMTH